jgi:hypothetical protein
MTNEPDPIWLEHELLIGLQALALTGDDQFEYHYHIGACPVCELISEFRFPYEAYIGNFSRQLTSPQIAALRSIAVEIEAIGAEDTKCFNREVLDRAVWVRLRGLAAAALTSLGWPIEAPISYRETSPGVFARP